MAPTGLPGCATGNASAPCLYDVLADPNETGNVAAAHPDVVARLAEHNVHQRRAVRGHIRRDRDRADSDVLPRGDVQ